MEKKIYYAPVNHPRCGDDLDHPWKYAVPAYRVTPHVWNVGGQDDVCAYLFETGDGLLLIDTGYRASFYLLMDRIWGLGHDPREIKTILLSHWHWDHVNGARYLQEISGCKVYLSRRDEECHQRYKNETDPMPMVDYNVTNFYDDEQPIRQGRFTIHTKLTPGHTPGATSFHWEDMDDTTGKTYRCAMHGGIGVGLMTPVMLERWGTSMADVHCFVKDCTEMANWPVDICVPSHLNQGNVLPNIPTDKSDYSVWVADYAWKDCMLGRAEAVRKMYPEEDFSK